MEIFHLPEKSWSQPTHRDLSVNITNPGAWATAREIDLGGEESSITGLSTSVCPLKMPAV